MTTPNKSPMVGVFLSHCRDRATGAIAPWAQTIIDDMHSYTEVDAAGTGIQIFAYGTLPGPPSRRGNVEMRQLTPDEARQVLDVVEAQV